MPDRELMLRWICYLDEQLRVWLKRRLPLGLRLLTCLSGPRVHCHSPKGTNIVRTPRGRCSQRISVQGLPRIIYLFALTPSAL